MNAPPVGVVPLSVTFDAERRTFVIECIDTRTTEAITISGTFAHPLTYAVTNPSPHRLALAQLIRAACELAEENR